MVIPIGRALGSTVRYGRSVTKCSSALIAAPGELRSSSTPIISGAYYAYSTRQFRQPSPNSYQPAIRTEEQPNLLSHAKEDDSLVSTLLQNPELTPSEAASELRWIRDEVRVQLDLQSRSNSLRRKDRFQMPQDELVRSYVERRGQGEPLQYILGTTDFGPLTLKCVRPVLIPRPETAFCTSRLASAIASSIQTSSPGPSTSQAFSSSAHKQYRQQISTVDNSGQSALPSPPDSSSYPSGSAQSPPLEILDLCTGSGCIALLLAHLIPSSVNTKIRGIDNSAAAVNLACINVADHTGNRRPNQSRPWSSDRNRIENPHQIEDEDSLGKMGERVSIRFGDIFKDPLRLLERANASIETSEMGGQRKVAMIVSNPPYVPLEEYLVLPHSVRTYESPSALLGDPEDVINEQGEGRGRGLKYYERIADLLPDLLLPHEQMVQHGWENTPRVALEVGHDQAQEVVQILRRTGIIMRAEVWEDQYGVQRFVVGWTA